MQRLGLPEGANGIGDRKKNDRDRDRHYSLRAQSLFPAQKIFPPLKPTNQITVLPGRALRAGRLLRSIKAESRLSEPFGLGLARVSLS